jgi:hypothetical protein
LFVSEQGDWGIRKSKDFGNYSCPSEVVADVKGEYLGGWFRSERPGFKWMEGVENDLGEQNEKKW